MIIQFSPNYNNRPSKCPIDTLVIHYTGMGDFQSALTRLCDPNAEVSAHYLINENGQVYNLVCESKRAWHAGVSFWRGRSNINDCSIGIELVNPGHDFGYRPFSKSQMISLTSLCKAIMLRHPIEKRNVVGHSDIAPRRKQDPGEKFCWKRLADNGIGLWPLIQKNKIKENVDEENLFSRIGYEVDDITATVIAFQRRFRPEKVDGIIDLETKSLIISVCNLFDLADERGSK